MYFNIIVYSTCNILSYCIVLYKFIYFYIYFFDTQIYVIEHINRGVTSKTKVLVALGCCCCFPLLMLRERCALAQDGDVVLIYHSFRQITPLRLQTGSEVQIRGMLYKHDDIIGRPLGRYIFGHSIRANIRTNNNTNTDSVSKNTTTTTTSNNNNNSYCNSNGRRKEQCRLLILPNSANLWTQAVPHRTQIIYDTDIAVIVFQLRLKPGSVVVEAGTGSGSLTHSLVNAVAPHGHVYTCDFHRERCVTAEHELRLNGLGSEVVSCHWRDVCSTNVDHIDTAPQKITGHSNIDHRNNKPVQEQEDANDALHSEKNLEIQTGFGLPASSVDAVFLDVPAPWSALTNVRHVLRGNGVLCTFSPCIEQTQRTVEALRSSPHEFVDIRTVEALTKFYDPVYKRARAGMTTSTCSEDNSPTSAVANDVNNNNVISNSNSSCCIANSGNNNIKKVTSSIKFKPRFVSKGHSAYLTFARRILHKNLVDSTITDDKKEIDKTD